MPVGTATGNKIEVRRELRQAHDIRGCVTGMTNLDTVQSTRLEPRETLSSSVPTRMGPYCKSTRGVRKSDSLRDIEAWLGDVGRPACTEIPIERFPVIGRVSGANQDTRNVWTSERCAGSFGEYVVDTHGRARARQALDDRMSTLNALTLKAFEAGSQ